MRPGSSEAETASIVTVEGPLEPERLRWIADLYGQADAKYQRDDVLSHLFTEAPAGPALHSFVVDDERPVGHCAVVPHPARHGNEELRCGKLEALWVEESHRGRPADGQPLYRTLLDQLYAFADDRGFELIHGHATPRIGRVIRFQPLEPVGKPSWVGVISASGAAASMLAAGQRALRAFARPRGVSVREATGDDADLVDAPPPPAGRWAPVVGNAWDWYRSSPLVRVLEGADFRALIQLPATPFEPVRIVGWRPRRPGVRPAASLLAAAARIARDARAPTVRFQPWPSPAGDGALERACRLLGFVRRRDQTTLWVRAADPTLARPEAVLPSPLFYLGF